MKDSEVDPHEAWDEINEIKQLICEDNVLSYHPVLLPFVKIIIGNSAADELDTFRELGCSVWLDDFGQCYSDLVRLLNYNIDGLKIDAMLVSNLNNSKKKQVIVESLINIGSKLNIDIIAEGVEREEEADALKMLGCKYAQGYLFGRPGRFKSSR